LIMVGRAEEAAIASVSESSASDTSSFTAAGQQSSWPVGSSNGPFPQPPAARQAQASRALSGKNG
jgi:hypothetical protein